MIQAFRKVAFYFIEDQLATKQNGVGQSDSTFPVPFHGTHDFRIMSSNSVFEFSAYVLSESPLLHFCILTIWQYFVLNKHVRSIQESKKVAMYNRANHIIFHNLIFSNMTGADQNRWKILFFFQNVLVIVCIWKLYSTNYVQLLFTGRVLLDEKWDHLHPTQRWKKNVGSYCLRDV